MNFVFDICMDFKRYFFYRRERRERGGRKNELTIY
jgi:hypothetical protein